MKSLKILHLSHMPELYAIGSHAFSHLNNLEEFHCTHNYKLKSIDANAFNYKLNDGSEGELWSPIVKVRVANKCYSRKLFWINHFAVGFKL